MVFLSLIILAQGHVILQISTLSASKSQLISASVESEHYYFLRFSLVFL
jgi:hypothetical protein